MTASGVVSAPLGAVRLKVVRLLGCLIRHSAALLCERLASLGTLHLCLELFAELPNNNLFHNQVSSIVTTILTPLPDGSHHQLLQHLIKDCSIHRRLMTWWDVGRERRLGFMGHVATMATVLSSLPPSTQLSADVTADWTDFCSGHLAGYLQLISSEIGGPKPRRPVPASDDEGEPDGDGMNMLFARFCEQDDDDDEDPRGAIRGEAWAGRQGGSAGSWDNPEDGDAGDGLFGESWASVTHEDGDDDFEKDDLYCSEESSSDFLWPSAEDHGASMCFPDEAPSSAQRMEIGDIDDDEF